LKHGAVFIIIFSQAPDRDSADAAGVFIIHLIPLNQCEIIIVFLNGKEGQRVYLPAMFKQIMAGENYIGEFTRVFLLN
jgi:hypothetical protein